MCDCECAPTSQKPGLEMGLYRMNLWRTLLSYNLGPHESHERPANFVRSLYQQKHCQPMKGTEMRRIQGWKEERKERNKKGREGERKERREILNIEPG